jgi:hypothetical protein
LDQQAPVATALQEALRKNLAGMKGWLKFLAIMNIITGAVHALSLVGILWAWLPIWLGIVLLQAGGQASDYAQRGDEAALVAFAGKLKTYFLISGIVMIVSIALVVVGSIMVVGTGMLGMLAAVAEGA